MRSKGTLLLTAATVAVVVLGGVLRATPPEGTTTITVPDMHCGGCARKMAKGLQQVPGVADVKADVPATTLTVAPKAQQILSARALWEAVEKAGYHPSKLEGPGGTFTDKPQS